MIIALDIFKTWNTYLQNLKNWNGKMLLETFVFKKKYFFYNIELKLIKSKFFFFSFRWGDITGENFWLVWSGLVWFGLVWFGLVLWHINHCKLFNAKSIFIRFYFETSLFQTIQFNIGTQFSSIWSVFKVKCFQVLLCITNSSIKYHFFKQLNLGFVEKLSFICI